MESIRNRGRVPKVIGINLLPLSGFSGQMTYSQHLLRPLIAYLTTRGFKVVLFVRPSLGETFSFPGADVVQLKVPNNKLFFFFHHQILFPFVCRSVDTLFSPATFFPFVLGRKNIVTLHDCAYERIRSEAGMFARVTMRILYRVAGRFAGKIVTVSEFSAKELRKLFGIPRDRVVVAHEGVPVLVSVSEEQKNTILEKFNISRPYVLTLDSGRPRKNLSKLIEAFALVRKQLTDINLVLAGVGDGAQGERLKVLAKSHGIDHVVRVLGYVSEEEKSALYHSSLSLALPSVYEGFGLQVLEAQLVGVPVVAADNSSFPEVAGKGAVFFDPHSDVGIAKIIISVVTDEALRSTLREEGKNNLVRFSWKRSAEKVGQSIEDLL